MGYQQYSKSQSDMVLKDTSKLTQIITDLVVLHEELLVVLEIVEAVHNKLCSQSVSGRVILLDHVLRTRKQSGPKVQDTLAYLMHNLSHSSAPLSHPNVSPINTHPQFASMSGRQTVVSDGQPSSNIGTRKNDQKYISRDSGMISSSPIDKRLSIGSPPPDASLLPPPAMSKSQIQLMLEESHKSRQSDSSFEEPRSRNLSQGDSNNVFDQTTSPQVFNHYHRFSDQSYKPVLFSISGNEEEEWPINEPLNDRSALPQNRLPPRVGSLDCDEAPKRSLCKNSSTGDLLDTPLSPNSHYTRTYPPAGNHADNHYTPTTQGGYHYPSTTRPGNHANDPYLPTTQGGYHADYHTSHDQGYHYQTPQNQYVSHDVYSQGFQQAKYLPHPPETRDDWRRNQPQYEGYPQNQQYQQNLPGQQTNNYGIYGTNDQPPLMVQGSYSSMGAGTRRRSSETALSSRNAIPPANARSNYTKNLDQFQYGSVLMQDHSNAASTSSTWGGGDTRQVLRQLSREKPSKQMTSSGAAASSRPTAQGWSCTRCKYVNESDLPGCVCCGEIAYWVDLDPLSPNEKQANVQPKKIETDSSMSHRPPAINKKWECPYCFSANYSSGNVCSECHAEIKADDIK